MRIQGKHKVLRMLREQYGALLCQGGRLDGGDRIRPGEQLGPEAKAYWSGVGRLGLLRILVRLSETAPGLVVKRTDDPHVQHREIDCQR